MDFVLVSDLHMDVHPFDISIFDVPENKERILLNLGDTFTSTPFCTKYIARFMSKISVYFKYVIFCLGNHDFYSQSISDAYIDVKRELQRIGNDNIIFLDGDTIFEVPDTNIVVYGDTVWSWMPKNSKEQNIQDYMSIMSADKKGHLHFKETNEINAKALNKIKNFLKVNQHKNVVIATHFPPKYYDTGYPYTWLSYYFHNDDTTDKWFKEPWMNKVYWIHGHTHCRHDRKYMNTHIISNARGYSLSPKYFPKLITVDDE